jgi:hypothetical protein
MEVKNVVEVETGALTPVYYFEFEGDKAVGIK